MKKILCGWQCKYNQNGECNCKEEIKLRNTGDGWNEYLICDTQDYNWVPKEEEFMEE